MTYMIAIPDPEDPGEGKLTLNEFDTPDEAIEWASEAGFDVDEDGKISILIEMCEVEENF